MIIEKLLDLGADIQYSDPYFNQTPPTRKHKLELRSKPINAKILSDSDIVLLITDHDDYDYDLILKEAKLIIDTRGRFNSDNDKIVKA